MAVGTITRIVGGNLTKEIKGDYTIWTDNYTINSGGKISFTSDEEIVFGSPPPPPPAGKYFDKGWWSSDFAGKNKITNAKVGDTVYFQIEMTDEFPNVKLKEKQNTIHFNLYQFDGNEYSIGYMYVFGPIITVEKNPKKEKKQKISYVTWEDVDKDKIIDPEEEYSKKPYTEIEAKGRKAVISFQLSEGLRQFFTGDNELKLFMSLSYDGENEVDLPEDDDIYLDVELYCCEPKCREPWDDLVKHDPKSNPTIQKLLKEKNDKDLIKGTSRALLIARSQQGTWGILSISDAYGEKVNMDYYSIKITKLPTIKDTTWSADLLFDFVRKNLGLFLNGNISSFYAYNDTENLLWQSTNPIYAVMKFHVIVPDPFNSSVIFDDAAVMCTSFVPNQSWIFSPVETPDDHQHPVSGNRQFGLRKIDDGYEFYIRGADRLTGVDDVKLGGQAAFDGADKLWKGFQNNLIDFITRHRGKAEIDDSKYVWKRCKWEAK